jgi:uncharacterized circularly permuted ATP-grasp superfamily protein
LGRPEEIGPEAAWNALALRDPRGSLEQARGLEASFREAGILFAGAPMGTFLRPCFLSEARWARLLGASRRLLELAARAARTVFGGDVGRLCDFLGTPAGEAVLVAIDPGEPDVVLSRVDAFWTEDGPRFIEINSDAPAGFGYGDRMARVFEALPLFQEFRRRHPVRYVPSGGGLVEALLGTWAARRGRQAPRIAILDWAEVKTRSDQEILRDLLRERGHACELVDPRDLATRAGKLVGPAGPIDLVYRRLVLSELVGREDEVPALLEAYRAGSALFVNSLRCRLSEDKAFLAILTDPAHGALFTPEEGEFLRSVVPWTRRISEGRTLRDGEEVDLVPHVLARRSELVLKPAHGYGGASVIVGDEASPEAWEKAVLSGLHEPVVVQARVAIPEEAFPVVSGDELRLEDRKVNVNPFYAGRAEVGTVARASLGSVINVSAGGGSVPTFVTA